MLYKFCVTQEGDGLMKQNHYASKDIEDQIVHLELTWKSLLVASEEKKERLLQAYQVDYSACFLRI